jgi:hypothetical protein
VGERVEINLLFVHFEIMVKRGGHTERMKMMAAGKHASTAICPHPVDGGMAKKVQFTTLAWLQTCCIESRHLKCEFHAQITIMIVFIVKDFDPHQREPQPAREQSSLPTLVWWLQAVAQMRVCCSQSIWCPT